jgi:site-specific recombinase XerD
VTGVAALTASHLDAFPIEVEANGYALLKTLCRFGHRRGFIADDLMIDLKMPKTPHTIIETFTDEQLTALLSAPNQRRWIGSATERSSTLFSTPSPAPRSWRRFGPRPSIYPSA